MKIVLKVKGLSVRLLSKFTREQSKVQSLSIFKLLYLSGTLELLEQKRISPGKSKKNPTDHFHNYQHWIVGSSLDEKKITKTGVITDGMSASFWKTILVDSECFNAYWEVSLVLFNKTSRIVFSDQFNVLSSWNSWNSDYRIFELSLYIVYII